MTAEQSLESLPDAQRFAVGDRVYLASDPVLQGVLASIHDTGQRPRCLCVPGGVDMYVARHRRYLVKRMPETGAAHHPSCPSYEPDGGCSGLGELLGEAVLEKVPGQVELRVDFPWSRCHGPSMARDGVSDLRLAKFQCLAGA